MALRQRWPRVSRHQPCPICGKADWCQISPDGRVAACMRVPEGAAKVGTLESGHPCYYHRLSESAPPPAPAPPRVNVAPFDLHQARALYAAIAAACAAELPASARQDLAARFGPHAGEVIARFGIGYCPAGDWLPGQLCRAGWRDPAIRAGVVTPGGETVNSLAGRLVIPYRRGGEVWDLRGAGIKGAGQSGEQNLHGTYHERQVAALFFNHDALDALGAGGTIHLAGGAWKTIALALAGLPAIGTRGEGELSDAQIADLLARQVGEVVLHVDAEDPKPGRPLSEGRRLGLHKARRLRDAGLTVRVAEPPREPGTPKVDPDALLRDHGPALLRAIAVGAPPLDAWERAIGVGEGGTA
ncbi:MAG: hypothetical protein M3Q65_08715, partial [Chloroflexota bacterium]|nr:hypothetical protein [Chloroflexota bacterium]